LGSFLDLSQAELALQGTAGFLAAEVLAVGLRDDATVGPDPVEEDVAVLVLLVAVADDDILKPVEVVAAPLEVLIRDAGHLLVREWSLAGGEAERDVLHRLPDVGAQLAHSVELARELAACTPGHVPADDLGLVFGVKAVSFVKDVACGALEAAAARDLGNHN
jgi:hypothetical protein